MTAKIMIVDDEIDISELIELQFIDQIESGKYDFIFAKNGLVALELLIEHPDTEMVLTDINMAGMDGLTLLKEIHAKYPNIKTIVVSAYGDMGNIRAAMNYGAFDFLTKPMDKRDLQIVIEKTVQVVEEERKILEELELSQKEKYRSEMELKTAATIQKALFPKEFPNVSNMAFSSFFRSATEAGGDWYGFMSYEDRYLYILIGDVTGHGVPAALVTASASATCVLTEYLQSYSKLKNLEEDHLIPSLLMDCLNKNVFRVGSSKYLMTFFGGCIDLRTGMMHFSNAAHQFPLIVRKNGDSRVLLNANPRLGETENVSFTEGQFLLQPGDLLFLYTDGLIENENPEGQMWGESRLKRYLKSYHQLPVKTLVDNLVDDVFKFYDGHPFDDDVTILACQVLAPFPEQSGFTI